MTTGSLSRQEILDDEHLRLLSLFYYVRAGTTAFFACIPIVHVIMGIALIVISHHAPAKGNDLPPAFIGWIFLVLGSCIIAAGWTIAVLQFLVGRYISGRRHRTFCLVIAALNCLAVPYGTLAGVLALIVLTRASVRTQFHCSGTPPPPPPPFPAAA